MKAIIKVFKWCDACPYLRRYQCKGALSGSVMVCGNMQKPITEVVDVHHDVTVECVTIPDDCPLPEYIEPNPE